ncbi:MAG TPA: enoyl-CoA hydratase/isomerase family protein [Dehalococcoidia bacterium]|nr:enoyl-CoA hydratase/isomerase family protein [Dehalococcoidia bacterium]
MTAPFKTLHIEKRGHIGWLRLCRAGEGNPIDLAFLQELGEAAELLNDDADVRAVVLTAEGPDFSIGWRSERDAVLGELTALRRELAQRPPFACLEQMGPPVIAAIRGRCHSAGLELALACDVRLASEDARFAFPEVDRGTIPMAGGTQRLPRLVGRGRALELLLFGEERDAQWAREAGLVSAVAPVDRLETQAEALAGRMAERGPIALRYAKEAVHRGLDLPLDEALRYETDLTIILQTTEDRAEGVRAFLEKRRPEFRGR